MPRNVEIKASIRDPERLLARAAALADGPAEEIRQQDVFFIVPRGRLKLRVLGEDRGELIYYERPDSEGPKTSIYHIAPTATPARLRAALEQALGVRGEVRKTRTLFLVGQTRIHVDEVEGLGWFLELEVVLEAEQAAEEGRRVAERLMTSLGVPPETLIAGAYLDLLERRGAG